MEKTLYPWQEECLEKWFANRGRGMVQAVTGAGKTLFALTAADRLEKKLDRKLRVKIVVPTGALMRQWNGALQDFLTDSVHSQKSATDIQRDIGLRGGGLRMPSDRKYMIYVINSARYELSRQIIADLRDGAAVLMIADECHRYESEQNRLIFEFLPYIKEFETHFFSLGLSATLSAGQARSYLSSVLGKKIYSYGMAQASAMHNICPYDIFHIALSFRQTENDEYQELTDRMGILYLNLLKTHPYLKKMNRKELFDHLKILAGDRNEKTAETAALYMKLSFKRKSLVCLASDRIFCTCDLVERLPPDQKILIFGERISQADKLYLLLQERYPEKVGRYHSRMGQQANRNALNRFRDGSIRILIACKAMDEGVDVPDVAIGIVLSGTSMQRQRIQRLGRIIRKKEGKGRAALYYLHITESAEDACFLSEAGDCHILDLEYLSDMHEFVNPRYNKAALELLHDLQSGGTDTGKITEAMRCLQLGSVRTDWLLEHNDIKRKILEAQYTGEKNYWICMKKVREKLN